MVVGVVLRLELKTLFQASTAALSNDCCTILSSQELRSSDHSLQDFCLGSTIIAGLLYLFLKRFVGELVRLPVLVRASLATKNSSVPQQMLRRCLQSLTTTGAHST